MTIYQPYAYLVGWTALNKWYYGIEYGAKTKTANPINLWKTYFTSSKEVKKLHKKYGDPDVIQIRKTFNTANEAIIWENKVLRRIKASRTDKWINSNVAGAIFMTPEKYIEIGKKTSATLKEGYSSGRLLGWRKGKTGKKWTDEQRNKMSRDRKGVPKSPEHAAKVGIALRNIPKTKDHRKKLSLAVTGYRHPKTKCMFCEKEIADHSYEKHIKGCIKNPSNNKNKNCPACNKVFYSNNETCSVSCASKLQHIKTKLSGKGYPKRNRKN